MAPQWAPVTDPKSWLLIRRVVTFLLGCAVIIDALIQNHIGTLVVGAILVGVLPVDDLFRLVRRDRGGSGE